MKNTMNNKDSELKPKNAVYIAKFLASLAFILSIIIAYLVVSAIYHTSSNFGLHLIELAVDIIAMFISFMIIIMKNRKED